MEGNNGFSWLGNPDSPKDETERLSGLRYVHNCPLHEDIYIP